MQDTAGIFLISCNRNRFFPDMMDVSMLNKGSTARFGKQVRREIFRQAKI